MSFPDFEFEKKLWVDGLEFVVGVDEVGRGAFAGPLVAGAVVFPKNFDEYEDFQKLGGLNDSKKLNEKERNGFFELIKDCCLGFGFGEASNELIDERGVVDGTNKAMKEAVFDCLRRQLSEQDHVLVDAFGIKNFNLKKQTAIVKGDQKSLSIAAASVVAKVYRDELMVDLSGDKRYSVYGWEMNKGYGTLNHRLAIEKYGVCDLHRRSFVKS